MSKIQPNFRLNFYAQQRRLGLHDSRNLRTDPIFGPPARNMAAARDRAADQDCNRREPAFARSRLRVRTRRPQIDVQSIRCSSGALFWSSSSFYSGASIRSLFASSFELSGEGREKKMGVGPIPSRLSLLLTHTHTLTILTSLKGIQKINRQRQRSGERLGSGLAAHVDDRTRKTGARSCPICFFDRLEKYKSGNIKRFKIQRSRPAAV